MKCIDVQFKDATPQETIARVRRILRENGMTTNEHVTVSGVRNCYSLGVYIDGTKMYTNGKGVSEELARASGYGEMMERLQSGWLTKEDFHYRDAAHFTREQLRQECGQWLRAIAEAATRREKKLITEQKVLEAAFAADGGGETVAVLPYYDVIGERMTWFPRALNEQLYITNGLAAGNSPEEAMVQGFSEIFERHYRFPFFLGDRVPPTVPEDYLKKFDTAYSIIQNLRASGMDVMIKDCSCGQHFPLVAAVVIDKENGRYRVHMGASPVFEIALERSLTEMFQGISLQYALTESSLYAGEKGHRGAKDILGLLVRGLGAYPLDFFTGEPTEPFEPFPVETRAKNADLLAGIVKYLKDSGKSLLVRDLSHLGFCTYQILVPGLSEVVYSELAENLPIYALESTSKRVSRNLADASEEELQELQILWRYKLDTYKKRLDGNNRLMLSGFLRNSELSLTANENVAYGHLYMAYLEWACGNRNVVPYAQYAASLLDGEDRTYLRCWCQLQPLAAKLDETAEKLRLFYPKHILDEVYDVISQQKNPFRRFLICCDLSRCDSCRFQSSCTRRVRQQVFDRLDAAVAAFDEEAAFEKIRVLFHAIDAAWKECN